MNPTVLQWTMPKRLVPRQLVFMKCGVCGQVRACKHYDHDLNAPVCRRCMPDVRTAERVLKSL